MVLRLHKFIDQGMCLGFLYLIFTVFRSIKTSPSEKTITIFPSYFRYPFFEVTSFSFEMHRLRMLELTS